MFRKSVRIAGRVAVSAALSWTLIPIAIAEAPAPMSAEATSSPQPGEPSGKQLFTVPEDGMGDDHWLSGATRVVREIMLKRPNEDLVICIAGCVAKQDRVVYAQPAELPRTTPAALTSDGAPSVPAAAPKPAANSKTVPAKPVAKAPDVLVIPELKPAVQLDAPALEAAPAAAPAADPKSWNAEVTPAPAPDALPAIAPAAKAGSEEDSSRMEFVPSMAAPTADEPAAEAAPAADDGEGAAAEPN